MTEDDKKLKSRVDTMEEAVQILKKLALRYDERMDDFQGALNNLTMKIEALADSHIRTEETLESLTAKVEAVVDAQIRVEEMLTRKIESLAASHQLLTAKVEALADAQIRMGEVLAGAQLRTEESLTRLADSHKRMAEGQARLAEAQAHTEGRLDALIDIVREGRGGGAA